MAKRKRKPSPRTTPSKHSSAAKPPVLRRVHALPRLPARPTQAHKGDFGRVLVIGGSRGMIGAPALAAMAALRSGAGLVTIACPRSIQPAVAGLCPCATTIPIAETAGGMLDPERAWQTFAEHKLFEGSPARGGIAAGPGLGRADAGFNRAWNRLVGELTRSAGIPVVLDADALNTMEGWLAEAASAKKLEHLRQAVLTPHPGEMARLGNLSPSRVQARREETAVEAARHISTGAAARQAEDHPVVVLKGAGTIVTDGIRLYLNKTGNPGMATGGSGDVLTGIIAALIAQGMSRFDAAVLGVHVHGRAGDRAAKTLGRTSLIATDLIDHLPAVFKS